MYFVVITPYITVVTMRKRRTVMNWYTYQIIGWSLKLKKFSQMRIKGCVGGTVCIGREF